MSFKFLGRHVVRHTANKQHFNWASIDPRLGFRMMFDFDIPASRKLLALGSGIVIAWLLIFLEIPLTLPLAAVPGVGLVLDLLVDGSEALFGPMVIACMLMPRLAGPSILAKYEADKPLANIDPDIPHPPVDGD